MTTGVISCGPFEPADFGRLVHLTTAAWDHDEMGVVNTDRLRDRFLDHRPGRLRSARVWEVDGTPVALAAVWRDVHGDEGHADAQVEIHPAHRRPELEDEVVAELRSTAIGLVGQPVALRVHARDRQAWKGAMLGRHGFVVDRAFHRMARDLTAPVAELVVPAGYAVRPLARDGEVAAWCEAATAAFAGHYDAPRFAVDERRRRMRTPEYTPAADLVAVGADGRIAGVAWSFRERLADGSGDGNVNYVAVLPAHRGRGVARALLLTSLRALGGLDLTTAVLAVDAGNETNALRLYESAGFAKLDAALVYLAQVA